MHWISEFSNRRQNENISNQLKLIKREWKRKFNLNTFFYSIRRNTISYLIDDSRYRYNLHRYLFNSNTSWNKPNVSQCHSQGTPGFSEKLSANLVQPLGQMSFIIFANTPFKHYGSYLILFWDYRSARREGSSWSS